MGRLTEQIQQKIHSELLPWAPFPEARLKTESLLSVDKRYTKDKAMGLDSLFYGAAEQKTPVMRPCGKPAL